MKQDFDLVVIGAGIIGACTAWYARQRHPDWHIALVDRSLAGSGASYFSAALDFPYGHSPLRRELAGRSRTLFDALRRDIPDLPVKDLSFYGIVQQHKAAALLEQFTDKHTREEPAARALLQQQFPGLQLNGNMTVLAGSRASQAIHNTVANRIAEAFSHTARSVLYEATPITKVQQHSGQYVLLTGSGENICTRRVVQATGPWLSAPQWVEGVRVKKIIAFHIHEKPAADAPVLYFFEDEAFLLPKYEMGYWLFSYCCDHWGVSPETATLGIRPEDKHAAMKILEKYYPAFVSSCSGGRVFCDGYTDTGDPLIQAVAGYEDYIVAGACAGSGYRLGPGIAEKAVEQLTH